VALNFTVRRGVMFLTCCGGLISFVVDPDAGVVYTGCFGI